MGFRQFYLFVICFIFSYLSSSLNVDANVMYEGPAVIHESDPFSLSCFTNLFATLKWRQNDSIVDFENSDNYLQLPARNETHQYNNLTIKTTLSKHSGNYKCSYDSDDFGHNLTVIFAAGDKLKVTSEGSLPCSSKSDSCVLGVMYEKLTLKCPSDVTSNNSLTLAWYKKGESDKWQPVTDSSKVKLSAGQVQFMQLTPDDVGNYTCRVTQRGQEKQDLAFLAESPVEVRALPIVVPTFKDLTVVEENTINLTCTVIGKASRIIWNFGDKILLNGTDNRVELREFHNVREATLLIRNANTTTDRGHYNCTAVSDWGNNSIPGSCYVRVKSKYAALGPFIGICAEVIILCTIILIYEKKRDKTELEESDTDQGPETKSSPDHGQDSVRYRK